MHQKATLIDKFLTLLAVSAFIITFVTSSISLLTHCYAEVFAKETKYYLEKLNEKPKEKS